MLIKWHQMTRRVRLATVVDVDHKIRCRFQLNSTGEIGSSLEVLVVVDELRMSAELSSRHLSLQQWKAIDVCLLHCHYVFSRVSHVLRSRRTDHAVKVYKAGLEVIVSSDTYSSGSFYRN
jgi:hypothetical protein